MSSKRNPPMTDFGLRQAKCEQQTSNDQASAPVANDGNNDGNENGNGKQQGNRLPWATKTSDATATNNGGDGSCGDRDGGDGAWGWLLEKGMNEGKWQRRAQRGRQRGNFYCPPGATAGPHSGRNHSCWDKRRKQKWGSVRYEANSNDFNTKRTT